MGFFRMNTSARKSSGSSRRGEPVLRFLVFLLAALFLAAPVSAEQKVFMSGGTEPFPEDAELLTVRFAGLMGGDCMLVTLGDKSMFVDVGTVTSTKEIREVTDAAGIDHADIFFNSHPHSDHIGGFIPLLDSGFSIGSLVTFFPHDYMGYCVLQIRSLKAAEEHGVEIVDMKTEDTFSLGSAELTAWRIPDHRIMRGIMGPNDLSAILMLRYGDCSILFAGDIEDYGQRILTEEYGPLMKADILKYPHHGITACETAFIESVSPEAVFSTNTPHRTASAQRQLKYHGISKMSFTSWGMITLQTDGHKWIASQEIRPVRRSQFRQYRKDHSWIQFPADLP